MRNLELQRPGPALVVSVIALSVALGGTGYGRCVAGHQRRRGSQAGMSSSATSAARRAATCSNEPGVADVEAERSGPRSGQRDRLVAGHRRVLDKTSNRRITPSADELRRVIRRVLGHVWPPSEKTSRDFLIVKRAVGQPANGITESTESSTTRRCTIMYSVYSTPSRRSAPDGVDPRHGRQVNQRGWALRTAAMASRTRSSGSARAARTVASSCHGSAIPALSPASPSRTARKQKGL